MKMLCFVNYEASVLINLFIIIIIQHVKLLLVKNQAHKFFKVHTKFMITLLQITSLKA